MEVQTRNIFYITTWEKEDFYSGKLIHPLFYPGGKVELYFCLLPREENLLKNKWRNKRQKKRLFRCLSEAYREAGTILRQSGFERFDVVMATKPFIKLFASDEKKIRDKELQELWRLCQEEIPEEMFAAFLYDVREKNREPAISITLPRECPEMVAQQMVNLLNPYLSRINLVIYVGEPSRMAWMLEEYFYEEYGIVTIFDRYPQSKCIWVNLAQSEDTFLNKYVKESEIYLINCAEVLKFLDTAIKNGYNNKVN